MCSPDVILTLEAMEVTEQNKWNLVDPSVEACKVFNKILQMSVLNTQTGNLRKDKLS